MTSLGDWQVLSQSQHVARSTQGCSSFASQSQHRHSHITVTIVNNALRTSLVSYVLNTDCDQLADTPIH